MGKKLNAQLAFYKASKGDITDKLIAWWTHSHYSHVELVVGNKWISTSPRTKALGSREINYHSDHWTMIDVVIDGDRLSDLYSRFGGCGYDWTGIVLTQFIPLGVEDPQRLFCSEWCAMVLGLDNPSKYSPGDLFLEVMLNNKGDKDGNDNNNTTTNTK